LTPCPFCELPVERITWQSTLVVALRDAFPVSKGHTLLVPRRHVATFFDASPEEHAALFAAVVVAKRTLDAELHPDGYNVGFNCGAAAGQTVMHAHVHIIPRYAGDMADPRGGVRGVIPGRQRYGP
jgi:diadenosine tetraphosphate (Ap4A) HIT family hydrolase